EALLGLVSVAASEGDVHKVVIFNGDRHAVAEALIQLATLEVKRACLVEPSLHPRGRGAHVERNSDRLAVQSFGGGVAALGVPANRREVAAAQSDAGEIG